MLFVGVLVMTATELEGSMGLALELVDRPTPDQRLYPAVILKEAVFFTGLLVSVIGFCGFVLSIRSES